jgi:methylated-DNA-[protein]-cysteine S-methyltransferase
MTDHVMTMPSPVGTLTLIGSAAGLRAVLWLNDRPTRVPLPTSLSEEPLALLETAARQLDEYFNNTRTTFEISLDMRGTAFQRDVWRALLDIAPGQTESYSSVARRLGRPSAARAIGAAIGRNPISIIVPCHRVVGADGSLTGFAGGLDAKIFLLHHEHLLHHGSATGPARTSMQTSLEL